MPQVKQDVESFARIRVIGVGGSGQNAINHMVSANVKGVEFVSINTDAQDLHHSKAKKNVHIGKNLTRGLGAGGDPTFGKRAAEETQEEILETVSDSDMVFIAGGMGGGTGTGAAPVIARLAKEAGALTVGIVTKPFSFEGQQRMRAAEEGIASLQEEVDALIVIPNDRLMAIVDRDTSVTNAFALCDDVLRQAVEGISDLITTPGIVNVDFADIRTVMQNAGSALMGIGLASGEKRAEEAAQKAINSPLLEVSITGARGVLFAIAGGEDLGMLEIQDAARVITESIDPNARVIFGAFHDEKLKKDEVKVTVIATGFSEEDLAAGKGNLFSIANDLAAPTPPKEELTPGQIHNAIAEVRSTPRPNKPEPSVRPLKKEPLTSAAKQAQPKPTEAKKDDSNIADDDDDDAEWGIPPFLRRSKIK